MDKNTMIVVIVLIIAIVVIVAIFAWLWLYTPLWEDIITWDRACMDIEEKNCGNKNLS